MAKRRLSDTEALTSRPYAEGESHSISSRKIENGFMIRETTCNEQTGEYQSRERFSPVPVKIRPPSVDGRQMKDGAGESALSDTMKYLSGR